MAGNQNYDPPMDMALDPRFGAGPMGRGLGMAGAMPPWAVMNPHVPFSGMGMMPGDDIMPVPIVPPMVRRPPRPIIMQPRYQRALRRGMEPIYLDPYDYDPYDDENLDWFDLPQRRRRCRAPQWDDDDDDFGHRGEGFRGGDDFFRPFNLRGGRANGDFFGRHRARSFSRNRLRDWEDFDGPRRRFGERRRDC